MLVLVQLVVANKKNRGKVFRGSVYHNTYKN